MQTTLFDFNKYNAMGIKKITEVSHHFESLLTPLVLLKEKLCISDTEKDAIALTKLLQDTKSKLAAFESELSAALSNGSLYVQGAKWNIKSEKAREHLRTSTRTCEKLRIETDRVERHLKTLPLVQDEVVSNRLIQIADVDAQIAELKALIEHQNSTPIPLKDPRLSALRSRIIGSIRKQSAWLYQWNVYDVTGSYSAEQQQLLLLEYVDAERQKFERLAAKFSNEQAENIKYERARIPENVRREVWRRDQGECAGCGSRNNLEYDHIVPVSRGGSNTA